MYQDVYKILENFPVQPYVSMLIDFELFASSVIFIFILINKSIELCGCFFIFFSFKFPRGTFIEGDRLVAEVTIVRSVYYAMNLIPRLLFIFIKFLA